MDIRFWKYFFKLFSIVNKIIDNLFNKDSMALTNLYID